MKILVFTEGTLIIHREWLGLSHQQVTAKVVAGDIPAFDSLVPIGKAVEKLQTWAYQGAQIVYLTSRRGSVEVAQVHVALERFDFPAGELHSRQPGETYQDVARRILPDVIVEDDCASIGGENEMVYPRLPSEIKATIRSVVVAEFKGIDSLPDTLDLE